LVPFFLPHGVYPTDRQTGGRRDTGPMLYACRRDERGQRQMHTLVEQIRRRLALDSVCSAHQRPTKTTLMQRLWCSVGDVITYGPRRARAAGQTRTYVRTHRESGEPGMGSRRQRCAVADILTSASARVRSRQTTGVPPMVGIQSSNNVNKVNSVFSSNNAKQTPNKATQKNVSRDLNRAHFRYDSSSAGLDLLPLTYRPNFKIITTPITTKIQNVEIGVVWG